uniref:Late embryogenesis abundant protein LEA-2 subgroup domain-containing protein n=1 Tax=Oryza meridionalis TaxID=40149 RepID=A0A0E0C5G7_9ORYZ
MEQQKEGLPGVNLAVGVVIFGILAFLVLAVVLMAPIINGPPDPNISIRLVGVEGLDPRLPAPAPPVFDLAVDVAGVSPRYHACGGGGGSKLRVSYHDIVLASALVPSFCIDGKLLEGGSAAGVVVVKARGGADGANAMIRGDLRNMIWTERHVLGRVNFDVSGNLGKESGLGDLSFRVSSFEAFGSNEQYIHATTLLSFSNYASLYVFFLGLLYPNITYIYGVGPLNFEDPVRWHSSTVLKAEPADRLFNWNKPDPGVITVQ